MARGQDAPNKSIEIDPYVKQSLLQGKEQANNRLIAAMQQAGASQRQSQAESSQMIQQGMAQQHQREMQAGEMEQEDKRAAEAEAARREDQRFSTTMQEADQKFQAERDNLQRAHELAVRKMDLDEAQRIREELEAARRFDTEKIMASNERTTNAMLTMLKAGQRNEANIEKAKTMLYNEGEKFQRDKGAHEKTVEETTRRALIDKRMDLPVKGEPKMVTSAGAFGGKIGGTFGGGVSPSKTEFVPGTHADPMGVLQDQIALNGSAVKVAYLTTDQLHNLEQDIVEGRVKPEDIRAARSVIDGMLPVVKQKIEEAPKKDQDFWREQYERMFSMKDSISALSRSKRQIKDSKMETVGARVLYALGPIEQTSLGGRVARMKELVGDDLDALFNEATKALPVPAPWAITPEMTDYEKKLRMDENEMIYRNYPDLRKSGPEWGAN